MTCERCKERLFFTEKGGQWVRECPICGKMEVADIVSDPEATERFTVAENEAQADLINHPPHYQIGGIETIDIIEAMLSPEEYQGYLKGNILKYRERAEHKGNKQADYAKAVWYMKRLQAIDKR